MPKTLMAIIAGGLIAGTVDIGVAVAIYHVSAVAILHAIASGLLGKASYGGGMVTAALGLLLQWTMSLIIAAIFVLASARFSALSRRWLAAGLAYGVVIFVVMSFVVVPLSAATPKAKPSFPQFLAMLLFGVIISWCDKKFGAHAEIAAVPAPESCV